VARVIDNDDQRMREYDEAPEDDALGDKEYEYLPTGAPVADPVFQDCVLRDLAWVTIDEYRQDLSAAGGKAKNLYGEQRVPLLYELFNRILGDDSSRELREEAFGQLRYLERAELEHWIQGAVDRMHRLAGHIRKADPWAAYELETHYRSMILLLEENCDLDLEMPARYPEPKSREQTNREETQC
jgi:hypothetical protein